MLDLVEDCDQEVGSSKKWKIRKLSSLVQGVSWGARRMLGEVEAVLRRGVANTC